MTLIFITHVRPIVYTESIGLANPLSIISFVLHFGYLIVIKINHVLLMNIHKLGRRIQQQVAINMLNTVSTCWRQPVARTSNIQQVACNKSPVVTSNKLTATCWRRQVTRMSNLSPSTCCFLHVEGNMLLVSATCWSMLLSTSRQCGLGLINK